MMNCKGVIGDVVAAISVIVSLLIFYATYKRDKKLQTMERYSRIRDKYPEVLSSSVAERKKYLNDMEFFCTGINTKIYDIYVLKKISGKRIISVYDRCTKHLIATKRRAGKNEIWQEYEIVVNRLKAMYCMEKYLIPKLYYKIRQWF